MKQLVEDIAKALVDVPEEVSVREVAGEQVTVLEFESGASDLGKGDRKNRAAQRAPFAPSSGGRMKVNRRFTLEILE